LSLPPPVRFTVWSDFLCPWCYVAAVRLHELQREVGDVLVVEWRSFLLRPHAEDRPLDKFTRYTQSWARPAEAEPLAAFTTPWTGVHAPPSDSRPSAIAGKAVLHEFGADGFDRFHLALMRAYFVDNRTISDRAVMLDVAATAGLDADALGARIDADATELEAEVVADHRAALQRGIAAVPTVVVNDEHVLQGAMALDQYRKVVSRLAS
jgi:predicted DsbA family dithiol-disulfide isomerase